MKIRILSFALVIVTLALSFASCDVLEDLYETDGTEAESGSATETETEEETDVKITYPDPLTGLPRDTDISYLKPLAAVIKNDQLASPQFGLSEAGIVYEVAVEGGLTRFLALFSDPSNVNKIGPVIDSRTYFVDIANSHEALLVQAGSTKLGSALQVDLGYTALDAVTGDLAPGFTRDPALIEERGYANSIIANGRTLLQRAGALRISEEHKTGYREPIGHIDYMSSKDMIQGGKYCVDLTIPFSSALTVSYRYSTLTDSYARVQYGSEHKDAVTGEQLRFTNIVILYVEHDIIDTASGEMGIDGSGSGTGYYVYGGNYIPLVWKKGGNGEPFELFGIDGITKLDLTAGNTIVEIVSTKLYGKITFE